MRGPQAKLGLALLMLAQEEKLKRGGGKRGQCLGLGGAVTALATGLVAQEAKEEDRGVGQVLNGFTRTVTSRQVCVCHHGGMEKLVQGRDRV